MDLSIIREISSTGLAVGGLVAFIVLVLRSTAIIAAVNVLLEQRVDGQLRIEEVRNQSERDSLTVAHTTMLGLNTALDGLRVVIAERDKLAEERHQTVQVQIDELRKERDALKTELVAERARAEARSAEMEAELLAATSRIAELEKEGAADRERIAELEAERAAREKEIVGERKAWQQKIDGLEQQLADVRRRLEVAEAEKARLEAEEGGD